MPTSDYTVIDKQTQLSAVNARIRDLERQRLDIEMRVIAPALGETGNQVDNDNLARLDTSLTVLRERAQELSGATGAPTA